MRADWIVVMTFHEATISCSLILVVKNQITLLKTYNLNAEFALVLLVIDKNNAASYWLSVYRKAYKQTLWGYMVK